MKGRSGDGVPPIGYGTLRYGTPFGLLDVGRFAIGRPSGYGIWDMGRRSAYGRWGDEDIGDRQWAIGYWQ